MKASSLANWAVKAAKNTRRLKEMLAREHVPSMYINDNFEEWGGEFSRLIERCTKQQGAAHEIAGLLQPGDADYVLMKPRHSAFYGSALEFLLEELEVKRLILTGLEADVCIFFTAQDAYVRQFQLWIPSNCVGTKNDRYYHTALEHMRRNLKATTIPAGRELRFDAVFPRGQLNRSRKG